MQFVNLLIFINQFPQQFEQNIKIRDPPKATRNGGDTHMKPCWVWVVHWSPKKPLGSRDVLPFSQG